MKKNLLEIGANVDIKIDGGVDSGVLTDKGVYSAKVSYVDKDGAVQTVGVPYKDIIGLTA